jgi:putative restriction endonuclease
VAKSREHWSALTRHSAPHKPFVLLAVIDLIAEGVLTENFVAPSFELVDTFNIYWSKIMPVSTRGNMAYPFCRLQTDGFWHLVPNPGYEAPIQCDLISSMVRLREMVAGATLDAELYTLLLEPEARETLRGIVVRTYFAEEVGPVLLDQSKVNFDSYRYSEELLQVPRQLVVYPGGEDASDERRNRVRDQGFRRAIVTLYNHRCALCGIRMLTADGHTIVEAGHIIPWKESYDDRPSNGMAMCRLCHWFFDEGLMTVGQEYEVLVSSRVGMEQNLPGHIFSLTGRGILKPAEEQLWPAQENLGHHRRNKFVS